MRSIANMPGIGGSLGMCALCGDGFMLEILLGQRVQTIGIEGMDKDVCVHAKCFAVLKQNGPDWRTLPDGPLKRAYAQAAGEPAPSTNAVDHPSAQPSGTPTPRGENVS